MNVLRHDYVPQNHQPIPPSHSLKNSQQQVPPSLATEQALTPIATERDEMQITRAIEVEALSGRQSPLPKSRAKPRDPSTKLRRKLSVMVEHGRSSTTPRSRKPSETRGTRHNIGGTSDNDTYTYYSNTGRMNTFTFTVGSTPKSIAGTLTWNQNGSLQQLAITDGFSAAGTQTCTYGSSSVMGYDDLGRLLNVNCGSNWQQTFSYDQFGNLTKTGSLNWACATCYNGRNQYNSTLAPSISYDSDGNLLNDTFFRYTWDVYGHPATIGPATGTITCGTSGTCLTYDANGNMVEKKSLRRLQRDSVQPNRQDGYDERTDGNQRLPSSSRRRNSVFNWQYCCHSALLA